VIRSIFVRADAAVNRAVSPFPARCNSNLFVRIFVSPVHTQSDYLHTRSPLSLFVDGSDSCFGQLTSAGLGHCAGITAAGRSRVGWLGYVGVASSAHPAFVHCTMYLSPCLRPRRRRRRHNVWPISRFHRRLATSSGLRSRKNGMDNALQLEP